MTETYDPMVLYIGITYEVYCSNNNNYNGLYSSYVYQLLKSL